MPINSLVLTGGRRRRTRKSKASRKRKSRTSRRSARRSRRRSVAKKVSKSSKSSKPRSRKSVKRRSRRRRSASREDAPCNRQCNKCKKPTESSVDGDVCSHTCKGCGRKFNHKIAA